MNEKKIKTHTHTTHKQTVAQVHFKRAVLQNECDSLHFCLAWYTQTHNELHMFQ